MRFLLALALLLAPVCAVVSCAAPAHAQESADEDQQQKELERIRQQAAEKRRRAQELKVKESKVLKELRATEARLRTTKTNIGALNKREQQLTIAIAYPYLETQFAPEPTTRALACEFLTDTLLVQASDLSFE